MTAQTLRLFPDPRALWTFSSCVKCVPCVPTKTAPEIVTTRLPTTLRTADTETPVANLFVLCGCRGGAICRDDSSKELQRLWRVDIKVHSARRAER